MIPTPIRVYAYETAQTLAELQEKIAERVAEGWKLVSAPSMSEARIVDGEVVLYYRQEFLKFVAAVSPAGVLA